MKLRDLMESPTAKVRTETGTAMLDGVGGMVLDDSGYQQHLSKEQLAAAWSGASVIPYTPEQVKDIQDDFDDPHELANIVNAGLAHYDENHGLWVFGDEMHEIPDKAAFGRGG